MWALGHLPSDSHSLASSPEEEGQGRPDLGLAATAPRSALPAEARAPHTSSRPPPRGAGQGQGQGGEEGGEVPGGQSTAELLCLEI